MDELLVDAAELCTHNFAHHVMESILENGEDGGSVGHGPWMDDFLRLWDLALQFGSSIPSRP